MKNQLSAVDQVAGDVQRWAKPEEIVVPTICQQCPGGCGLLARTLDGEVSGISGNPLHPINRGAVCPKAFGGLQLLYDSNRIKGPMARNGERGLFRAIGWDEALKLVTARLSDLRAKGLAHTLAILGGQYRGYRDTLWSRFAQAYGTPNYIRLRSLRAGEAGAGASAQCNKVMMLLAYDLAQFEFILSFGAKVMSRDRPGSCIAGICTFAPERRPAARLAGSRRPAPLVTAIKADRLDLHRPRNRWDLSARHRQRHDPRRAL